MTEAIKRCTKCGQDFPATTEYFHYKNKGKGTFQSCCKSCMKVKFKTYYDTNADAMRERSRVYQANNQEKENTRKRRYEIEHPEKKREWRQRYYRKYLEKVLERTRQYRLLYPDRVRETVRLSRLKHGRKDGDPEKRRQYNRTYRVVNYDRVREMERRYHQEHPERRRANNRKRRAIEKNAEGNYTDKEVLALYELQEGRCCWCGCQMANKFAQRHLPRDEKFTEDHIIPLTRSGTNWIWNIVLACWDCNCNRRKQKLVFTEWQPPNMLEWMRDYVLAAINR